MPSKRTTLAPLLSALVLLGGVPQVHAAEKSPQGTVNVYIGTYTGKKSLGIYLSRLDTTTGSMSTPELAAETANPSWITIHPSRKFLFAAGESGYPEGGAVTGFTIAADGKLTAINKQGPNGKGPCHLAIDSTGKVIVVSNYGDGSVSALKIAADGSLSPSHWVDQHPALSDKQKPHAHAAEFDPSNQFAVVADAGIDRLYVYRLNAATGDLTPNDPPFLTTATDTHPRHLTFSADGKFCYNIDERSMSVSAFSFDAKKGTLRELQSIPTLPKDFDGKGGSTAELIMHPSGKFLYGSNRGHDSIVAFSVDAQTGKLTLVGHASTQGKTPRGFGIDPTGKWLLAGNQSSDTIVQFKIDQTTGALTPTGTQFELGAPVCFKFLENK